MDSADLRRPIRFERIAGGPDKGKGATSDVLGRDDGAVHDCTEPREDNASKDYSWTCGSDNMIGFLEGHLCFNDVEGSLCVVKIQSAT